MTTAQRLLVEIMSKHQFGRIENVPVQAGQPVLDRGVKVVRVARLGGESGGTTAPNTEFELKQPVRDLFDELDQLRDGVIVRLEFRRGLPCLVETTANVAPGDPTAASEAGKPES